MSCPFLDPSMLARLPAEKREELKEMYHKMKKEESEHLKIDIKEDEIDNVSPEQMLMGMTGTSANNNVMVAPHKITNPNAVCPITG